MTDLEPFTMQKLSNYDSFFDRSEFISKYKIVCSFFEPDTAEDSSQRIFTISMKSMTKNCSSNFYIS